MLLLVNNEHAEGPQLVVIKFVQLPLGIEYTYQWKLNEEPFRIFHNIKNIDTLTSTCAEISNIRVKKLMDSQQCIFTNLYVTLISEYTVYR